LHLLNIAHKDITFANILIDDDMNIKLADFGASIDLSSLRSTYNNQSEDQSDIVAHYSNILSQSLKFWQQLDCKMIGVLLWKMLYGPSLDQEQIT
jgi:serine/threonine protein kinase